MSTDQQLMKVLVQQSHKGPKDLTLTADRPRPVPGPGEYLIRVGAAGVNFADVMQSRGVYEGTTALGSRRHRGARDQHAPIPRSAALLSLGGHSALVFTGDRRDGVRSWTTTQCRR